MPIENTTSFLPADGLTDEISVQADTARGLVELKFGEIVTAGLSASAAIKLGRLLIGSAGVVVKARRKKLP